MANNKVSFSINEYDDEGDKIEAGIYLHFLSTRVKVANTSVEFDAFIDKLTTMAREIKNNYLIK